MKILIVGPVGSGKTTQAKLLADYLGIPSLGMGQVLREMAKENSPQGQSLKEDLDKGKLADDAIVAKIARERIAEEDCQNGFIFDGYPRSLTQIKLFDPGYDRVFYLDISDTVAEQRLLARGRDDDTPEIIKERLRIYHQETEPLLEFFEKQGILQKIDGGGTIEEIQERIRQNL